MSGSSATVLDVPGLDICTQYWFVARAATCAVEAFSEPFQVTLRDTDTFVLLFDLPDSEGECDNWIIIDTIDKITGIENTLISVLDSTVCDFIRVGCFSQSTFSCEQGGNTVTFRYMRMRTNYMK